VDLVFFLGNDFYTYGSANKGKKESVTKIRNFINTERTGT